MDIIDRINEVIISSKESVRAYSNKIGVKQQTLSSQLNRTRELSLTTVMALLTANEELSAEWLIRGKGSMYKEEGIEEEKSMEKLMRLIDTISTLQEVINDRNQTISLLNEQIRQLTNKINNK